MARASKGGKFRGIFTTATAAILLGVIVIFIVSFVGAIIGSLAGIFWYFTETSFTQWFDMLKEILF